MKMLHERNADFRGYAEIVDVSFGDMSYQKRKNCNNLQMIKRSWLLVVREGTRDKT